MKEKVIIVNSNDEIIGSKERETLKKEDIYRVSVLWVINSKNEILLAKRAMSKKNHPGMWGPAVAGTNDEGETYESNIIKETSEEIGVENIKFQLLFKEKAQSEYNHFTQWFFIKLDKNISEFTIQKEEVDEIKWISKEEFLKEIQSPSSKILTSIKKSEKLIEFVKNDYS